MLPWLPPSPAAFPPVNTALEEPDGLLAAGGDLTPDWLISAYSNGIFPWFSDDQPILWWSPDPRMVLFPQEFKPRRSLAKRFRNAGFTFTFNQSFKDVMTACAQTRADQEGTWITDDMMAAYHELHRQGYAHSVEVWRENTLAGGLYGVGLGECFFGESMFSREADASKCALTYLVAQGMPRGLTLIDCQMHSNHLASLGARLIARDNFLRYLEPCQATRPRAIWLPDATAVP
ncbi:leucyl/phenylalanyl-tRNA--protein transferase [Larsenimonas rhizosphaerae]|uniref:Leucyl/phenylalanyl-tRNA--protein transferase n=1 Tax=Larsenimonas rhizosphaerae TaxID=2944682 RepID=A0AA41ZMM1_9GAMM|nr:leucyl/phenylalanyl-tRNA--protein transferase [Larsenimonas rhizosphaerae]MCM2132050.1 leucyl/phenylalanyl-tRNA--protein transferase [Larsenimonas rhizosphaerae]MCX2524653.1 leucyl/phenylalanyl-tRNA--protein transferase [Larsenimonas rhizosphaerae]